MISVYSAKHKQLSQEEFNQLYHIIIKAYADTEALMWGENYVRVSKSDFQNFIDEDKVLVAFLSEEVVGGLRYYAMNESTWSFGLFGADFSKSRMGIGRALIAKVENLAARAKAKKIRIEILRPTNFEIEIKTILANWYISLGYVLVGSDDFATVRPKESIKLLCPCNFDYYEKSLGTLN